MLMTVRRHLHGHRAYGNFRAPDVLEIVCQAVELFLDCLPGVPAILFEGAERGSA